MKDRIQIPEPKISRFLFSDTRMAWFWFLLRCYVGWQWLSAGWGKLSDAAWTGNQAGTALQQFLNGAISGSAGTHPNVSPWYASFLQMFVLSHVVLFAYFIVYSEFIIGILLILGALTGIAAFAGAFLNLNYLFAGALSINPILLVLELFLVLAWRNAGWWGLDQMLLPGLGVPWKPGTLFHHEK